MTKSLEELMGQYYTHYYRDTLKLADWQERIQRQRLNEEESIGKKFVSTLEGHVDFFPDMKVLVVGAGTGAEGFYLHLQKTSQVYMCEPYLPAIEILKLKAKNYNLKEENIIQCSAESLPYEDGFFDLCICYTVLEHVQSYQKALEEMVRVTKAQGKIVLQLPNYAYPEEPHYKVKTFPPAYFKPLARLHLKLLGRYTPFFEELNFLTAKDMDRALKKLAVDYKRIYPAETSKAHPLIELYKGLTRQVRSQEIVMTKRGHGHTIKADDSKGLLEERV